MTPVLQASSPILVGKGELARVTKTVTVAQVVTAPVTAGQQLGTMTIEADGRTLAEIPIIASAAVERLTLWELTVRLLRRTCMGG